MKPTAALLVVGLAGAAGATAQEMPSSLAALAARARLDGPVAAWCRAEFRAGFPGAFAAAVASAERGGRYVALDSDGKLAELASFTGRADLSCYSRKEADTLDDTIRRSDTIHGRITPRWTTTVVCGFVDDTSAACWQYSPVDRAFVKIGEWIT